MSTSPALLSEDEVRRRLSFPRVLTAVERALKAAADGSAAVNPVVIGRGLNEGEVFSIKSGVAQRDGIVGLKVGSYWPRNVAAGMPAHGSTILLLDPETGRLMAVLEASLVNGPRTAAADAAAARVLARPDLTTLTLIGAGHQAAHEALALCEVLPIEHVLIASRTRASAEALRERLRVALDIRVDTTTVEQGCRAADILVTVTPSRAPLFEFEWLKAGVHVASMGSDQAGKQELPPALLRHARLYCDLPSQSLAIGEFQHIRKEVEAGEKVLTPIGDVLAGRVKGRHSADEITVFDSSGLALQDLFVAASLLGEVA